jgi:predicted metalloprotease with PDZ domain
MPLSLRFILLLLVGLAAPVHALPVADWRGEMALEVDIRDLDRRLFRVAQTIPVTPGPFKLWYPQWLPGNHAPRGPIEAIGGLVITANGQRIEWTRDPLDVYAFHLTVPEGASQLELRFDYATPFVREQGRIVATPNIAGVQWNAVLLYPAVASMAQVRVQANLKLPSGWQAASALQVNGSAGETLRYAPVPLETLIDSPVFAGQHLRRVPLGSTGTAPVHLNIFGDHPAALAATPEQLAPHARLLREAEALFGARHFDRYEFLFALSEFFSGIGLEHHRSSENAVSAEYFTEWDKKQIERGLLPHEYAHSWVGKFRRPAGQMAAHYNTPLDNELLWVYGGRINTGARYSPRAAGCGARRSRASPSPGSPRCSTPIAPAARRATCKTRSISPSSRRAGRSPGPAGNVARTTTMRAC